MPVSNLPFKGPVKRASISATIVTDPDDFTLVAAVSGAKIRVLDYVIVVTGDITIQFQSDTAGTALTGAMDVIDNSILAPGYSPIGHFETVAGELLNIHTVGAAGSIAGYLSYIEV